MWYLDKVRSRLQQATLWELGLMKVCLIAFTLLVAKLWPTVLALHWGWYAGVFAVTYIYLIYFFLVKK